MSSIEIQKADVAVAIERAKGAVEITVFFSNGETVEKTEILPHETVSGAFYANEQDFEKFIKIESDCRKWDSLADVLGFME